MKENKIQKLKTCCYSEKVIPLAFNESMSYLEQVCALKDFVEHQVVPNVNMNEVNIEELRTLINSLELNYATKDYVDTQDTITLQSAKDYTDKLGKSVLNVEIEKDGFGGYRTIDYNDNDINNARNSGKVVQAKYYDDVANQTYTYYYSTMESDRKPTFIRTYIEAGVVKQVLISVDNAKKVTVETRTATGSSTAVNNSYKESQTETYSCDYVNNLPSGIQTSYSNEKLSLL